MTRQFSERSEKNLVGVNADLVAVTRRALEISEVDFTVVEGLRTLERQKKLLAEKKSQTLKSRHLIGEAVDLYPFYDGQVQVAAPHEKYRQISRAMLAAADELGVRITWGGDWKMLDMPHYQIEL